MAQKKAVIGATSFILVLLLLVGYFALAADVGGKEDPLVTVNYLNGLEPSLNAKITEMLATQTSLFSTTLENRIAEANLELQAKIDEAMLAGGGAFEPDAAFIDLLTTKVIEKIGTTPGSGVSGISDSYSRVLLAKNKNVTVNLGTTFFLRTGTATCVSSGTTGLIDLTDGSTLENGAALKANHLYCVTFETGRGFKVTSEAYVFIQGGYTIS